jgi:hypothetical protein
MTAKGKTNQGDKSSAISKVVEQALHDKRPSSSTNTFITHVSKIFEFIRVPDSLPVPENTIPAARPRFSWNHWKSRVTAGR